MSDEKKTKVTEVKEKTAPGMKKGLSKDGRSSLSETKRDSDKTVRQKDLKPERETAVTSLSEAEEMKKSPKHQTEETCLSPIPFTRQKTDEDSPQTVDGEETERRSKQRESSRKSSEVRELDSVSNEEQKEPFKVTKEEGTGKKYDIKHDVEKYKRSEESSKETSKKVSEEISEKASRETSKEVSEEVSEVIEELQLQYQSLTLESLCSQKIIQLFILVKDEKKKKKKKKKKKLFPRRSVVRRPGQNLNLNLKQKQKQVDTGQKNETISPEPKRASPPPKATAPPAVLQRQNPNVLLLLKPQRLLQLAQFCSRFDPQREKTSEV
ncbi:hypothetical protein WMY93_002274 [Mugilogobius chulae]|uniref:Uncharacterized protein n=1 Tax=Mugilogobius chulae TaxID=88201 RepID=A0AAW0PTE8_9GOBI